MGGNNIGDELTAAKTTWGWFQGGFDNGYVPGHGTQPTTAQICAGAHQNVGGVDRDRLQPAPRAVRVLRVHRQPAAPAADLGGDGRPHDQANHQYDIADFWAAADAGNLPAVSYLKAPAYQDGHAGYSDPLDEQTFLANTINQLESLPTWSSTAVVITYDDSDGWYDQHARPARRPSRRSLARRADRTRACAAATPRRCR